MERTAATVARSGASPASARRRSWRSTARCRSTGACGARTSRARWRTPARCAARACSAPPSSRRSRTASRPSAARSRPARSCPRTPTRTCTWRRAPAHRARRRGRRAKLHTGAQPQRPGGHRRAAAPAPRARTPGRGARRPAGACCSTRAGGPRGDGDARLHAPAARAGHVAGPAPARLLLDARARPRPARRRARRLPRAAARRRRGRGPQLRARPRGHGRRSRLRARRRELARRRRRPRLRGGLSRRRGAARRRTSAGWGPSSSCGRRAEFGFVRLPDAYSGGSSIMPQKKNPDAAELMRAAAPRLTADLGGLLGVLHGLPLAYNTDLREDKRYLFDAVDCLDQLLPVVARAARGRRPSTRRAWRRPATPSSPPPTWPTTSSGKGVPFREAHHVTGALVRRCLGAGREPRRLPTRGPARRSRRPSPTTTSRCTSRRSAGAQALPRRLGAGARARAARARPRRPGGAPLLLTMRARRLVPCCRSLATRRSTAAPRSRSDFFARSGARGRARPHRLHLPLRRGRRAHRRGRGLPPGRSRAATGTAAGRRATPCCSGRPATSTSTSPTACTSAPTSSARRRGAPPACCCGRSNPSRRRGDGRAPRARRRRACLQPARRGSPRRSAIDAPRAERPAGWDGRRWPILARARGDGDGARRAAHRQPRRASASRGGAEKPWRFVDAGSRFLSRPLPRAPRR